jgi:hypothetical protein
MSKDIYDTEIRAIKEAYDALKCLDMTQTQRALAWLESNACELDNLRNTLLNLLERSEPKTENFDLIGE